MSAIISYAFSFFRVSVHDHPYGLLWMHAHKEFLNYTMDDHECDDYFHLQNKSLL